MATESVAGFAESRKTGKALTLHKKTALDVRKLGKLIRLLASDSDGEVAGAVAAIGRTLLAADMSFADLAAAVETGLEKPKKQQQPARWSPPTPDLGWDASWEALAWFSHYHRHHLSDPDRNYVYDVLMG
jgi:hypothetical protein